MSSANPPPVEVIGSGLQQRRGQMEEIFDRLLTDFLKAADAKFVQLVANPKWDWGDAANGGNYAACLTDLSEFAKRGGRL